MNFFEKPNDDELYKTYKRFEALYNEAIDEYDNFNNKEEGFRKIQESMVNNLEKAVIIALKRAIRAFRGKGGRNMAETCR